MKLKYESLQIDMSVFKTETSYRAILLVSRVYEYEFRDFYRISIWVIYTGDEISKKIKNCKECFENDFAAFCDVSSFDQRIKIIELFAVQTVSSPR